MNDSDKERYSRQIILKGFGEEAQQKLNDTKVLVAGAGGLGCPALQYLVAAGIGTVGIADEDIVSLSNLHRQLLYSTDDTGLLKVDVAAAKLKRLHPSATIITYPFNLQNSNALAIIDRYDFIVDGTDNFASRYMINDACVLLGKPLVYGAITTYQGQLAVFNVPGKNGVATNYRDLFPLPPKKGEVPNCAEAGVLGVLPGIIGTMQAAEVIKLVTGIGTPLINKVVTYTLLYNEMYTIDILPSSAANSLLPNNREAFLQMNYNSFCNMTEKKIIEIDAEQLQAMRAGPSTVIIDVREVYELPQVTTFEHRQIPMSIFKEAIAGISEDTIILFCQHGIRSMYAAEMLQEKFGSSKTLLSLKGGISRWTKELLDK